MAPDLGPKAKPPPVSAAVLSQIPTDGKPLKMSPTGDYTAVDLHVANPLSANTDQTQANPITVYNQHIGRPNVTVESPPARVPAPKNGVLPGPFTERK